MRLQKPSPAMIAARDAVLAAMKPYADALGAEGLLAVLSYTVGQTIALQDQTAMTPDRAMLIVSSNIEQGNQDVIASLLTSKGGHA